MKIYKSMKDDSKLELLTISWQLHDKVETAYLNHKSKQDDSEWLEKQRFLLADMALHLFQTAMKPGEVKLERLRDNLHAIITISDQFLPKADLKKAIDKLYNKDLF